MFIRVLTLFLALSSLMIIACSDSNSQQGSASVAATNKAVASSSSSMHSTNPCELLTESLVREFKSLAADVPIALEDKSDSRHPNCAYRWRVMSEAEEQKARDENNAKVMENLKAGKAPSDGIIHSIRTHGSVRLTAVEFDSPEKAQSALESARTFMTNRAKETGRGEVNWDAVNGVGDKAWYHGSQLSFTSNRLLMHLNASPLGTATSLANAIIQ